MISRRASNRDPGNVANNKIVVTWIRCRSWRKMLIFVIQWQRSSSTKSTAFKKDLSISLSFNLYSFVNESLMNYFNVIRVCRNINVCVLIYIVDLFQNQRTDPSILSFDIKLVQLMSIDFNRTDFFDGVIVTHSMKKILDSTLHWSFEYVIGIDVDGVTIFKDQGLTTWAKRL